MKKEPHIQMAIAYDFDGTLAPGNMQEYDFVPALGMTTQEFWEQADRIEREHQADRILAYMRLMLQKAKSVGVPVRRDDFMRFGRSILFYEGVSEWFDRIDQYAAEQGVEVKHYIISSGIKEMIEGTSIADKFDKIYASSFMYDAEGIAEWPALAVNYTTKTQYLFRINKGSLNICDHSRINKFVPKNERSISFQNMVFIGDGETDIPSFRTVKKEGGHAIAVYKPSNLDARTNALELLSQGRVNFTAPANYTEGGAMDNIVKGIIKKIAVEASLKGFCESHSWVLKGG